MKIYAIQTKNGIIMNVNVIGDLVKMIIYGILARVVVNVLKHLKLIKN